MSRLLRAAIQAQAHVTGVFVQKLDLPQVKRLMKTSTEDPVAHVLQNLNTVFEKECVDNYIDISSSVALIQEERAQNPKGVAGAVFLAWKMRHDAPVAEPVGIATVSSFRITPSFSTDKMSDGDARTMAAYDGWTYLDCLCSKAAGVGKLLVMNVFLHSLNAKAAGVVALSYTRFATKRPRSLPMFQKLGFHAVISNATFVNKRNMHGAWVVRPTGDTRLHSISESVKAICTRTTRTSRVVWRCPNV